MVRTCFQLSTFFQHFLNPATSSIIIFPFLVPCEVTNLSPASKQSHLSDVFIMPSFGNGSAPPFSKSQEDLEDHALAILPQYRQQNGHAGSEGQDHRLGDESKHREASASTSTSKIKCLDGLRGIACFLVFNYHFLWPWTPLIMLGYGARPPKSPEPLTEWSQLPIVCLLHRGRPMVAIFFAISGYVLCRHVLTAVHRRNLDEAYRKLSSSVFRRIFRLYLPPTISMFMVAILAQAGAFKSEKSIYKGPDSAWINGTITNGYLWEETLPCPKGTFRAKGREDVAELLGLQTEVYLNQTINDTTTLCLSIQSKLHMPAVLYGDVDPPKPKPSNATMNMTRTSSSVLLRPTGHLLPNQQPGNMSTKPYKWIQLGGSWEEHPIIHPHIFKALANFTVVYGEWANPFNFGHYHPRFDPHTWTIPKELRGSMVLYTFLLGTANLRTHWRLGAATLLGLFSLTLGHWDMGVFVGGMMLAELDILRSSDLNATWSRYQLGLSPRKSRVVRWLAIFFALYFLSYPDAAAEYTPGFQMLSRMVPRWYPPGSRWMWYQAIGAVILIPCVLRSPTLRKVLEGQVAQYLGKISFSFYLVHGPVLHSLGFWIMPLLFRDFGRPLGFVMGWFMLLSVTLYLSGLFYRRIDMWSMTVGRRLERALVVT